MISAAQILAISEDADVCDSIHRSLVSEGYKTICVTSAQEALQFLHQGLAPHFLMIHAKKGSSNNSLFVPALLENISSEKLCILSEAGDTSWNNEAAKWRINRVLTMPLMRHDIEKLFVR